VQYFVDELVDDPCGSLVVVFDSDVIGFVVAVAVSGDGVDVQAAHEFVVGGVEEVDGYGGGELF
jgi:hypothetical protein